MATSKATDNTRSNTFGLTVSYAYRRPFKNKDFSMAVRPGLSLFSTSSGTPDNKTNTTALAITTELDFRYHFNDVVYLSAGLSNTTMFASFVSFKTSLGTESQNHTFFQNSASIPNICIGFTF